MNIFLLDMGYINRSYVDSVEVGIGVMIVAGILKESGHNIKYCEDIIHCNEDIENIVQSIEKFNVDCVIFSTRCDNYILAIMIADAIKAKNAKIKVIFAGPQATHTDMETIQNFKSVDIIIRNEGEKTTKELCEVLEKKGNLDDIDGITYRKSNKCIKNKDRELLPELNYLPDYSIMPAEYVKRINNLMSAFRIEAGRGCPYGCTFCSTNRMWKRTYRIKSVEQIYFEMSRLNQMYGIRCFVLEHDSLSANRNAFRQFLMKMIEINQEKFIWKCSSRVDTLHIEDVDFLWEAGCREIYFGIESGSEKMQYKYKKGLTFNTFPELLKKLYERGIYFTCSFICGHPDEEEADFEKTLQLMLYCSMHFNCKEIQLHRLCPENGSELYDLRSKELILDITQVSDQAVCIKHSYEYDFIQKYPTVFASYYSFRISEKLKELYDEAIMNGVRLFRQYPLSIFILTKILNISILEAIYWNDIDIDTYMDILKSKLIKEKYKRIEEIYNFEKAVMENEDGEDTYVGNRRYLQVDLNEIINLKFRQSVYILRDKEGTTSKYLYNAADLMYKYYKA